MKNSTAKKTKKNGGKPKWDGREIVRKVTNKNILSSLPLHPLGKVKNVSVKYNSKSGVIVIRESKAA